MFRQAQLASACFGALLFSLVTSCGGGGGGGGAPPVRLGTAAVTVTTTDTSGSYTLTIDGGSPQAIAANTITGIELAAGEHEFKLDAPVGCTVTPGAVQKATVAAGETAIVDFGVTCVAPTGGITVATTTNGNKPAQGYTVAVDSGQPQAIEPTGTVQFSDVQPGTHTVTLAGVPAGCKVNGGNTRTVTVKAGESARATFRIDCPTTGTIEITTTTNGQPGVEQYPLEIGGTKTGALALNGVRRVAVSPGPHEVEIEVNSYCKVAGGATRNVTVTADQTTKIAFDVTCEKGTVFTHTSSSSNIAFNYTELDHPLLNGKPDAKPLITHARPSPLSATTGLWYFGGRWRIYREDSAPMPVDQSFFIAIPAPGFFQLRHRANASNKSYTEISNPRIDGKPDAMLFVSRVTRLDQNDSEVGVGYFGKWRIANQNQRAMPKIDFNVMVTRAGEYAIRHTVTQQNRHPSASYITIIDHERLNGNPSAVLIVTHRGQSDRNVVAVHYNTASKRWILSHPGRQEMRIGTTYNVLIDAGEKL